MRQRRTDPTSSTDHLPEGFDDPDSDWYVAPVERPNYRRDPAVEAVLASDPRRRADWLAFRGWSRDRIRGVTRTGRGYRGPADPMFVVDFDNDELEAFGHWHARERARQVIADAEKVKREAELARVKAETERKCHICGEEHDDTAWRRPLLGEVSVGLGAWSKEYGEPVHAGAACAYALWAQRVEHQPS